MTLLTPQEAANVLKVSERTLRRLKLPRVKLGKQYRYRQADIDGFINLHLEYPETGRPNVSRVQRGSKKVGLQVLPSRAMLQKIRLGYQNGGQAGGAASASLTPGTQPTASATAAGASVIASAEGGKRQWRIDGLHYTFKAHIIPHFGEAMLIGDITPGMIKSFILALKRKKFRGEQLKSKTIKNIVADLNAMYSCAMEPTEDGGPGLVDKNPVTKGARKLIGSTRAVKKAINPRWFDIAAAAIENKQDRAWFDVTRYLGMRKDESNRLKWSDVDWRTGKVRIPGTKTEEAEAWLPVSPAALKTLKDLHDSQDRDPWFNLRVPRPKWTNERKEDLQSTPNL